jgi:hypothetical protein
MNVSDRAATAQRHNQYHITRSLEKHVSQVAEKGGTLSYPRFRGQVIKENPYASNASGLT